MTRWALRVLFLLSLVCLFSCSSAAYRNSESAPASSVSTGGEYEAEEILDDEISAKSESRFRRDEGRSSSAPLKKTTRMMIYHADLHSTVDELSSAVDRARAIARGLGGYVEKEYLQKEPAMARFTFRVPVAFFHRALQDLSAIGEVSFRNINANDITREFADLSQRLQNLNTLLERLHLILQRTTETKQKIRILHQIARLKKQIDSMEARKKHMAKQASFSTIQVEFNARQKLSVSTGSPIAWIRSLRPDKRTLYSAPLFTIPLPEGFLDNSKEYRSSGEALFMSPDRVEIRTSTMENDPEGDLSFYERAILYHQSIYPDKIESSGSSNNRFTMTVPRQVGYNKIYYTISMVVDDRQLHIMEVHYPSGEAFQKHHESVELALTKFKKKSILQMMLEVFQ